MLRRRRRVRLETDAKLAACVTDRLTEGRTPERIAGRLRVGMETGQRAVRAESIHGWFCRAGRKAERLAPTGPGADAVITVAMVAGTQAEPAEDAARSCSAFSRRQM